MQNVNNLFIDKHSPLWYTIYRQREREQRQNPRVKTVGCRIYN
nr:MAG TPA: Thymidine kinase from Herpesvirus C-terminal [Caudoviricetes sp.]